MTVIATIYFVFPTRASEFTTFFRLAITFIVCERIPRCLIFLQLLSNLFEVYFPIQPMVCHTDLYKALNGQPDNISELLRIYNGDDVMLVLYQLPTTSTTIHGSRNRSVQLRSIRGIQTLTCSPTLNSRTVCIFENFSCIFNAVFI